MWLALLVMAAPASAIPVTVADARGMRVTERAAPRRIVSLTPATTEMLFALGLGGRVVGDTVYCDYPPAARRVAKIGDVRVNYERVVALRPDLIVGDVVATSAPVARLTQLRLPVFAVRPDTLDGVERSLRLLGQVTGATHPANVVVARMEAQRRQARALAARDPRRPRVLLVIGTNPLFVAGRGTFLDSLITEAGGVNAATITGYGALSRETVLAHPPDVILAAPGDQAALRADPALRRLPAVRAGRFVSVTDRNLLERPGPRVTEGLLQVARALHPGVK
ncbi:MAG: ABC transporter substrate-binding protein [Armatimonadetes bacterium]|nr:ABC transporter substrate-binding protein [Armatimonadota bacterium]